MGFTRNYKNRLLAIMASPYSQTAAEWESVEGVFDDSTFFTIKDITGTIRRCMWSFSYGLTYKDQMLYSRALDGGAITIAHLLGSQSNYSSVAYNPKKLVFGTNDSEESVDDYNISTISTISFNLQPKIVNYIYENKKLTNYYSCVIQSSTDVTINELGIVANIPYQVSLASDPSSSYKCDVLLYRKKLDTPIELTANVPQLVTFSIEFDYPA